MLKRANGTSKLKQKLDQIFSRYVRLRDSDEYGYGRCITCGTRKHWSEADAGHFVTRGKLSIRYDEMNVHLQCKQCNMTGEQYAYGQELERRFGKKAVLDLIKKGNTLCRFTASEYTEMIKDYQQRVNELQGTKDMG